MFDQLPACLSYKDTVHPAILVHAYSMYCVLVIQNRKLGMYTRVAFSCIDPYLQTLLSKESIRVGFYHIETVLKLWSLPTPPNDITIG